MLWPGRVRCHVTGRGQPEHGGALRMGPANGVCVCGDCRSNGRSFWSKKGARGGLLTRGGGSKDSR